MDRVALLIDAGYLVAAGGDLTCGTARRNEVELRVHPLLDALDTLVEEHAQLPLLRTYWYDGVREGKLLSVHEAVREHNYTKLRLGRIIGGTQKGVDSMILRDLWTLAHSKHVVRAYLLAGDEDLRESVVEAQSAGIQVVLLTVEPTEHQKPSQTLCWEADEVIDLYKDFLEPFFEPRESVAP